jgi:hypothetical protein
MGELFRVHETAVCHHRTHGVRPHFSEEQPRKVRYPFALVWGVRRRDAGAAPLGCGNFGPGFSPVTESPEGGSGAGAKRPGAVPNRRRFALAKRGLQRPATGPHRTRPRGAAPASNAISPARSVRSGCASVRHSRQALALPPGRRRIPGRKCPGRIVGRRPWTASLCRYRRSPR